ncbi:hypothetical protein D3C71_1332680 [compost metagenome]
MIDAVHGLARPAQLAQRSVKTVELFHLGAHAVRVVHGAGAAHGLEQHVGAVVEGRAEAVHRMLVLRGVARGVSLGRRQFGIDRRVDQHAFGGLLAGDVDDLLRGRPAGAHNAPFESEFARLLDDQPRGGGRVAVQFDGVDAARHHAGEHGHEIDTIALEELLDGQGRAGLLVGAFQVHRDLLSGLVVGEQRADLAQALRLDQPVDLRLRDLGGGDVRTEGVGLVRGKRLGGKAQRQQDHLVLFGHGLNGQHRRRPDRTDHVAHLVLEHQAIGHGDGLVGLVLVVIGHDLDAVLLAAHLQPARLVHLVGRDLGGVLHALPPCGACAGKRDQGAQFQRLLRLRGGYCGQGENAGQNDRITHDVS